VHLCFTLEKNLINTFFYGGDIMNNSISKTAFITFMLVSSMLVADAHAQFWKSRGQGRGVASGPNSWCPPGLNLTQEQTNQIQSLHERFFKETAQVRTDLQKKQLTLETMLLEPSVDADAAGKLQAEISALKSQLDQKRMQYHLEARKVLTAEQIAQLPPGCTLGFGPPGGRGCGFRGGCGAGMGYGRGWGGGW